MNARQPQSYRARLALSVGSLSSRLIFATPDRLARDAARSRRVRMSVYEDNHGCHHPAGSYRLHLSTYLPCVHG